MEDGRIRLEKVIATRGDLGRGRLVRALTGRPDPLLFERPFAVAWDGEALLVSDVAAGRVVRIDPRGGITSTDESLFAGPIGIAVCPTGIVVTDSRRGDVKLLDRNLALLRPLADGLVRPTGVTCAQGEALVAETGRHQLLRIPSGVRSTSAVPVAFGRRGDGDGEFNFPTSVTSHGGVIWVGDTLNFRVQRLSLGTGAYLGSFGALGDAAGEMPRLKAVAIDAAGQVWISDAHLDQVSLYDLEGKFLMALGRRGSRAGEFSFPAGIAAHPDGRVAVVDSLNRRVQIFRLLVSDPALRRGKS